jgi:hypothetical protein
MAIATNLKVIKSCLANEVTLVAVSKTKPNTAILEAYQAGQRVFGENKVQELVQKAEKLHKDIAWQMIGHLQTNKVKFIAPFVSQIHAVDSLKLFKEINKRAEQNNRIIDCLLQVHIATESSKFGFGIEEVESALNQAEEFKNIRITGLMGMATFTDDTQQVVDEFKSLKTVFDSIKNEHITTLSMGMSGDYKLAIEQGSTMIRVGSAIFGHRNK